MKNAIFISVRSNSTRLPNKATLDLCGKPTIQYLIENNTDPEFKQRHIENLKKSKHAQKIILCTSTQSQDEILCQIAKKMDIDFFRGSLEDKLQRWLGACKKYNIDFFVNADGDDLFFDHGLADHIFEQHRESPCDFIDGRGLYNDVYGISTPALKRVCEIKATDETEFIRPYFTDTGLFNVTSVENLPTKYIKNNSRMTLDYKEDFMFFEKIIKLLGQESITFDNVLALLSNNPDINKINFHLEEKWRQNQKKINKMVIK